MLNSNALYSAEVSSCYHYHKEEMDSEVLLHRIAELGALGVWAYWRGRMCANAWITLSRSRAYPISTHACERECVSTTTVYVSKKQCTFKDDSDLADKHRLDDISTVKRCCDQLDFTATARAR